MTRAEMLSELRDVLNDSAVNGIWGESTLLGYLSEGQDKFCELTGYFLDISNFTLTLATDTANYAVPDRVIQVFDIWDGARRLAHLSADQASRNLEWQFDPNSTGTPSGWRTDRGTGLITLDPIPTSEQNGDEYVLQVWRYSQEDLADTGAEPEIPSRFHRACIEWAAHKAFSHHDMETQDPVKARDHQRNFFSYTRDGKRALKRMQNEEVFVGGDPTYWT